MRWVHGPRVMLAAASTMALLAACGGGSGTRSSGPPTPPAPSATSVRTSVDLEQVPGVALDLSAMGKGDRPAIPWVVGRTLHSGDVAVPVPRSAWSRQDAPLVFAFGTGALRYDDPNGRTGTPVNVLDASGTMTYSAPATRPLLSWDRTQVAWWEPRSHEAVLGDTATGTLRRVAAPAAWADLPHSLAWQVAVVGWMARDDVLLSALDPSDGSEQFWRTSGKRIPSWTRQHQAAMSLQASLSPQADIAVLQDYPYTEPTQVDANCLTAVRLETSAPVWRECLLRGDQPYPALSPTFSADGTRLTVSSISITSGEPGYELVLDAADGHVLARFDRGTYEGDEWGFPTEVWTPRFEDDAHLLFAAGWRRHDQAGSPTTVTDEALVRCAVGGSCELAAPVVPRDQGVDGASPYQLP